MPAESWRNVIQTSLRRVEFTKIGRMLCVDFTVIHAMYTNSHNSAHKILSIVFSSRVMSCMIPRLSPIFNLSIFCAFIYFCDYYFFFFKPTTVFVQYDCVLYSRYSCIVLRGDLDTKAYLCTSSRSRFSIRQRRHRVPTIPSVTSVDDVPLSYCAVNKLD